MFSERVRTAEGVELHVVSAGPETGPLLIFLHGFPEAWFTWGAYLERFASEGFRVMAPDQRGYGESSRPSGIRAYTIDQLANDVVALIRHAGHEKAVIVGHDWGGAVAWAVAKSHPDVVEKLVVMDCPHPRVMNRHLKSDLNQIRKSWYILFFQLPFLPERALSAKGNRRLEHALTESSRPGTFTKECLDEYHEAWSQPGAITAMLNWYRAARVKSPIPPVRTGPRSRKITPPTLVLWGKHDSALRHEMAQESAAECEQAEFEVIEQGTHWIHREEFPRVSTRILKFIRG